MDEHTSHELAYKKGYEKGKQDAMKWIPVTERLPTAEDADKCHSVLAIEKTDGYVRIWTWYSVSCFPTEFTHWMPMPEPPKGE
jgi:hypothetical protein